jgi:hypothetical protein
LDNVKDTARKTQFRYSFSLFDRKKGRPTQSEHVIGGFAVHVLQSIRVPGGKKKSQPEGPSAESNYSVVQKFHTRTRGRRGRQAERCAGAQQTEEA